MTVSGQRPASSSATLRALLAHDTITRAVGAGDGLQARLAERHGFDALWASGLAISAAHAVPDASILTMTEFLTAAQVIDRACELPVLADCDTGFGDVNNVARMVREYERAGIAGVCIEDKEFPKRNSFTDGQELASIAEFTARLLAAKDAQRAPEFVVVARVESLIAGEGIDDALARAACYQDAGADAILIHSKTADGEEVLDFARRWRKRSQPLPLIAVPTTYYSVGWPLLAQAGISMVIYANQALRAAVRAVDDTLERISAAENTAPVESDLASVQDVLALIGMDELHSATERLQALPTINAPADSAASAPSVVA
ncbi:MAG TPA: isocitrate lyase/phosphoenolpyruvate mutase family protein [Solirubrobacteraceae bacterium]|jgi:phosphoenolpyruvate phosphomutase|nr:isocitrate lyase/phosphoenolpyruvate mutase family protein [Solirubrobacteraceae bacterium]